MLGKFRRSGSYDNLKLQIPKGGEALPLAPIPESPQDEKTPVVSPSSGPSAVGMYKQPHRRFIPKIEHSPDESPFMTSPVYYRDIVGTPSKGNVELTPFPEVVIRPLK